MPATQTDVPRFGTAIEQGDVTHKSGYHQPGGTRHHRGCGCSLTTAKGAYRDVTVELPDGRVVHFYHQSPVVVEDGDEVRLSSCGYRTGSTKERINRYIPPGYRVVQRDFDWYVTQPDGGREEFHDGYTIER